MEEQFSRTARVLGTGAVERLQQARVIIFGLGGVGGWCAEALARSGIGALDLVDDDIICLSNLNRQLFALHSTLGRFKTDAARDRILDINPNARVTVHRVFYGPDTAAQFDFTQYDYVVDAIDTVTGKLALAEQARAAGTPIISAMGAGNKVDPAAFRVADIAKTSVCPLARVMRKELKKRGIYHLKVVYSQEDPITPAEDSSGPEPTAHPRRSTPGSTPFVPPVAGMIAAAEVVKDLIAGPQARRDG